jgi:hypothetical protein
MSIPSEYFGSLFNLALEFGWKPRGTEHNVGLYRTELERMGMRGEQLASRLAADVAEWDGTYSGNDWQWVTTADAIGWADALTRAIPQITQDATWVARTVCRRLPDGTQVWVLREVHEMTAIELLAGHQSLVWEFIQLCRAGAFQIG